MEWRLWDKVWDKADASWCTGVGKCQGEEMWILQRICEEKDHFTPSTLILMILSGELHFTIPLLE